MVPDSSMRNGKQWNASEILGKARLFTRIMHDLIVSTPVNAPVIRFSRMRGEQIARGICICAVNLCVDHRREVHFICLRKPSTPASRPEGAQPYHEDQFIFVFTVWNPVGFDVVADFDISPVTTHFHY